MPSRRPAPNRRRRRSALFALVLVAGTVVARRLGYRLGRNTTVRCRQGHLFTTTWIPGGSLKAVRLGPVRFQRCPVGGHWSLVVPVKEANLTDAERQAAARTRDTWIP